MSTDEEPATSPSLVLPILGTLLHAGLLAMLFLMLVMGIPGAKKTFDEYGMTLPLITIAFIRVSNWFCEFWWVVAPLALAALVGDFYLMKPPDRRQSVLWLIGIALMLLLLLGISYLAVELPMMHLREALSP